MVEFALVLPILLLVITGIFSFGIALNNYLELTDAVSIGAQKLAVSRNNTTDPCSDAAAFIHNAAPYLNSSKLGLTFVLDGTTYGPYTGVTATTCSSGSYSQGAAGNLVSGQSAQVIATYPCTLSVYGYNLDCNLHAQITELVQ
jgi:Flp pilus assembly protein TadG